MFTTYRWFLFQNRTNAFFGDIIWWRYTVPSFLLHVFLYYIYIYIYLLYVYIIYFILHVFRIFKSVTEPPPFKDDSIMDKDFDISYPCYILSETYFLNHLSSYSYHFRYQIFVLWRKTNVGQCRHFFFPLPEEEDMTFINILTWLILTFPFKYEKERGTFLFSSLTKEHSRVLSWEYGQITIITKDGFNKISVYKWQ